MSKKARRRPSWKKIRSQLNKWERMMERWLKIQSLSILKNENEIILKKILDKML